MAHYGMRHHMVGLILRVLIGICLVKNKFLVCVI